MFGETVPEGGCCKRERSLAKGNKFGPGHDEVPSVRRAKSAGRSICCKKIREIGWGSGRLNLKAESGKFVLDPCTDWKPVQGAQHRGSTVAFLLSKNHSGCMVLCALQPIKHGVWKSSKEGVAVIHAREYKRGDQLLCCLKRQNRSDLANSPQLEKN